MSKKSKLNPLAEADNIRLLGELCVWIEENIDTTIGMQELIDKTNLSSTDIQFLFERYKQTTPITYIRVLREESVKKVSYLDKMRITPIFLDKDKWNVLSWLIICHGFDFICGIYWVTIFTMPIIPMNLGIFLH